jgi:hypothetical protein
VAEILVSETAVLRAAPEVVYAIFADYVDAHPRVLPRPPFGDLVVERGGIGAGTRFRVEGLERGKMRSLTCEVTEPQPGRVLVESDVASDLVTTFTVEPSDGGRDARVTISTRWTRGGVRGFVERMLAPRILRPVYRQELRNVEQLARERSGAARTV